MDCPAWTRWMASYGESGKDEREEEMMDEFTRSISGMLIHVRDEEEQARRSRVRDQSYSQMISQVRMEQEESRRFEERASLCEEEQSFRYARRSAIRAEEARREMTIREEAHRRSRQGEMTEEQASAAPEFMCHQCDLEYSSQAELADHQASEVGRGERTGKYPCAKCYRSFDNEYVASVHQAKHDRNWDWGWAAHRNKTAPRFISCPIRFCHMGFKTQTELQAHLRRVHAGDMTTS